MNLHNKCLICDSERIRDMKDYEVIRLCRCSNCNFVFSRIIPTKQELYNYYQGYGLNSYLSPLTIKRYNQLLDKFEPYRKTNKILDFGCGTGYFLIEAKKRGWEVYGVELSQEAIKQCVQKNISTSKDIIHILGYEKEMFDVIVSIEVLEHINNPNEELTNFRSILRKGGLVYVTTPNFNSVLRHYLKAKYNIIKYPEHLTYYTPATLKKVFEINGFKKIKIETTGLSSTRLKTSKGKSTQRIISPVSDDEKIRNSIEDKIHMRLLKRTVNSLLTVIGSGDSLKGWFVKSSD